jgi:hypothetical protein
MKASVSTACLRLLVGGHLEAETSKSTGLSPLVVGLEPHERDRGIVSTGSEFQNG